VSPVRGGLRARLVIDSIRVTILAGLIDLGWFDPTVHDTPPGLRRHQPLRYIPRPTSWDTPLAPNALAITPEVVEDDPHGFGDEIDDSIFVYADLFAENHELGWELSHDIEDILLGRLPNIGRRGPIIDVWDLRQATPVVLTQLEIQNVVVDRAEGQARAWQQYWFMVRCDLIDEYGDENGVTFTPGPWTPAYGTAWTKVFAT
jgi:hypothetical protein